MRSGELNVELAVLLGSEETDKGEGADEYGGPLEVVAVNVGEGVLVLKTSESVDVDEMEERGKLVLMRRRGGCSYGGGVAEEDNGAWAPAKP